MIGQGTVINIEIANTLTDTVENRYLINTALVTTAMVNQYPMPDEDERFVAVLRYDDFLQ